MYEGREGEFEYTVESLIAQDGERIWRWRVKHRFQPIATGMSKRSHVHAQTQALEVIFNAERESSARSNGHQRAVLRGSTPSFSTCGPDGTETPNSCTETSPWASPIQWPA
jgi:hypothetical protein